jgi:hypothetical protein
MPLAAEGAYIRLLSHQWEDGHIDADIEDLARLCRVSKAEFTKIWKYLEPQFPMVGSVRKNPRLAIEWEKASGKVAKNRANASLGGSQKSSNRKAKEVANGEPETSERPSETVANATANAKPNGSERSSERGSESLPIPDTDTEYSVTNVTGDPPRGGSPPQPPSDPPLFEETSPPAATLVKPAAEPFASVEAVLLGVAEALDTPNPTREEVTRWSAPSSTLRRLIGKYGVEGTVKLYVFAAKNTTRGGLDWNSIWNQNAALWAQMRDGVPQRGGGQKESLQDQQRRIAEALRP